METRSAEIYAAFGGEPRRFRICIPELEKIQEECGVGPAVVAQSLAQGLLTLQRAGEGDGLDFITLVASGLGDWKVAYVRSVLFHGLVGGGMDPASAMRLRWQWIDERGLRGLIENLDVAFRVIAAATYGPREEPVGESEGAAAPEKAAPRPRRSRTAKSASPSSAATPR